MSTGKWIAIARLVRTRGIKGELIAESLTSHPERLQALKRVTLEKASRRSEFDVARVWFHGERPVFQFSGIVSMNDAEPWVGSEVLIPAESRQPLPEGEYYFSDLIGCEVRRWLPDAAAGDRIGIVRDVDEQPAGALLVVDPVEEGRREILIPLARAICKEIDVAARVIRVDPPEGLLELGEG